MKKYTPKKKYTRGNKIRFHFKAAKESKKNEKIEISRFREISLFSFGTIWFKASCNDIFCR
jgi:hypothetical protein